MLIAIASIAAGGSIGAVARYGVGLAFASAFPLGTLIVNIVGSFLMGIAINMLPDTARPFVMTGLLGAFTTFSTFSLDTVTLWERGEIVQAGLYASASVILSIAALIAGLILTRSLLS